jgi:hypothetical protein
MPCMRLQGKDPEAYGWPEWSSPANTLRWIEDKVRPALTAMLTAQPQSGEVERRLTDARTTLVKTATSKIDSDTFTIPASFFWSVLHNVDEAIAALRSAQPVDQEEVRAMCERLRATRPKLLVRDGLHGTIDEPVNPDGRAAATLLEKLGPKQ